MEKHLESGIGHGAAPNERLRRLVSGGQTGADRAALDVALELGLEIGGWVPKGRGAEDGAIPERYAGVREAPSADPAVRTVLNVRDSDATLVVSHGALLGGSLLTFEEATRLGRPVLHLDLDRLGFDDAAAELRAWLQRVEPTTLNVAGPRASHDAAIAERVAALLRATLTSVTKDDVTPMTMTSHAGGAVTEVANLGLFRPPFIYLGAIATGLLLHFIWPVRVIPPSIGTPVGVTLTLGAIALFVYAVRTFDAAATPVPGNRPTTRIVGKGPYRFSRNPIYLAFSLFQLGLALWLNSVALLATLIPAVALMALVVIPREERYLEARFPADYLPYKASVRRWL